ncbi:MAG: hypothetical protein M3290_09215 [Actinomycetota bacterium]|nr:hypothetical protein [Actinomycetota bacterium]
MGLFSSFKPPGDDWGQYLGRKISIRYLLRDDSSHPFSEAVGVVQAISRDSRGVLQIVTRRRGTIDVAVEDVVALKVFP